MAGAKEAINGITAPEIRQGTGSSRSGAKAGNSRPYAGGFLPPEKSQTVRRHFVVSLRSIFRMHWDHEPGRRNGARLCEPQHVALRTKLLRVTDPRSEIRFMESLLSTFRMHRDHEPDVSCQSAEPVSRAPAVPSPLPSDGRGEVQGEVWALFHSMFVVRCSPCSWKVLNSLPHSDRPRFRSKRLRRVWVWARRRAPTLGCTNG